MSGSKRDQKSIRKEEVLQAVLIADDYEDQFSDFTEKKCSALIPIVGRHAIDYSLELLGRSGIEETIIFCSSHADAIRKHVANSHWSQPASSMSITVILSERSRSLGDAIRDIDGRALIKGNFVLLSAYSISNVKLLDALNFHREQCSKDKGTAMTLLVQDVGSRSSKFANCIFAINASSNRLLLQINKNTNKKIDVPLEYLLANENINIYSNLIDTGIAICSPSVPLLFADNFDFRTKADFVKGVLLNEEILDSRIYCYQLNKGYGATIHDWPSYQRVSSDIIHRWTFPLVPDQSFSDDEPFYQYRSYIYKQTGVHLVKSVNLEMDVVIGRGTHFEGSSQILRCFIGKNCRIGKNVDIRDSYIFDNCIIKDNCKIVLCVIGDGVVVKENSKLQHCFLKRKVIVGENSNLTEVTLHSDDGQINEMEKREDLDMESDEGSDHEKVLGLLDPEVEYVDEELGYSSSSESEESYAGSQEADDNTLFYTEVVESLQRGFEEKVPCENLILEINSSRYAYNVILKDVTSLTVKAIASIPCRVRSNPKSVFAHFMPLFKNYIKSLEAQMDCLDVLEEMHEELGNELVKCIHLLYDSDILVEDAILKWHSDLEPKSPIRTKVAPLIKWLEEAAEESSEEESE